ncbi:hypothetical protein HPG69_002728 [Diceros bicornis minor]|uniref:Pentraxin family member n=1 Tax=Diceros bicornis minor TaxID=77932 RepID=A0A7J7FMU3_DICBM|nr:hypothetical protein HPG69_002728 [Diceros bicornis minor]
MDARANMRGEVFIFPKGSSNAHVSLITQLEKPQQNFRAEAGLLSGAHPKIVLGQEQDSYGGGFDKSQSFVGDVGDWYIRDSVLSPEEIDKERLKQSRRKCGQMLLLAIECQKTQTQGLTLFTALINTGSAPLTDKIQAPNDQMSTVTAEEFHGEKDITEEMGHHSVTEVQMEHG